MDDKEILVSILLPAFNEEQILAENLREVYEYMRSQYSGDTWEMIVVNDGSSDNTGDIAEEFSADKRQVSVVHHERNGGLGRATKTGIERSSGESIIILDIDLSYGTSHIGRLLETLKSSHADIVLASPYMKGGKILNVPFLRRVLSIYANKFLSIVAHGSLSTLTCMVRGFNGNFARSMVLRSTGMEIMPETIYKSMILRGRLVEIPATLDWGLQARQTGRVSSMRIFRQLLGTLLSGFIFRPFMFFVLPGLTLLMFSAWVNFWMVMHFLDSVKIATQNSAADRISWAVADAYQGYPHTFIVGLLSLMLAIQLISLGILALQSKSYFEEVYYLGSQIQQQTRRMKKDD